MKMKWKLKTFRNKNGKNTWTNQGCGVFLTDSQIVYFVITLAFYLARVIWLALWVVCFAFVCSLITRLHHTGSDGKLSGAWEQGYFTLVLWLLVLCFVITNSVLMWQASVVHMGECLGMRLTMRVISLGFGMGPSFLLSWSGIVKAEPGRACAWPKHHVCHVTRSHTSTSRCPANTNDLPSYATAFTASFLELLPLKVLMACRLMASYAPSAAESTYRTNH